MVNNEHLKILTLIIITLCFIIIKMCQRNRHYFQERQTLKLLLKF